MDRFTAVRLVEIPKEIRDMYWDDIFLCLNMQRGFCGGPSLPEPCMISVENVPTDDEYSSGRSLTDSESDSELN